MKTLFGANWRTSTWGIVTLVATAIAFKPDLIAFLPDSVEGIVSGIAGLIAFLSGGAFVLNTKDKQVTGGTVQQTAEGCEASRLSTEQSSAVIDTQQARPKS